MSVSSFSDQSCFDVDFTLAVYNRTGKFFIGRDLIQSVPDAIGKVYYGPLPFAAVPTGLLGRVLGRLQTIQVGQSATGSRLGRLMPRRRSRRPMLHLDPYTVGATVLTRQDVVLCHDVGPLTHPALFDAGSCAVYGVLYEEIAAIGPHMVFISRASQRAFHDLFPHARCASSRVIYPALRTDLAQAPVVPETPIDGPFLLTVGSIGNRKNQLGCLQAFARSGLAERGMRYVLCGGPEPGFEDIAKLAATIPGVILMSYVSDGELAWLYDHAAGFVLASHLEGFGIPVAEAIARGQIPAVTKDSVLHEVSGDGALLVDADDPDDIARAMQSLAGMDGDERQRRKALLGEAIQRFTLETFAHEWQEALSDILHANARVAADDRPH